MYNSENELILALSEKNEINALDIKAIELLLLKEKRYDLLHWVFQAK